MEPRERAAAADAEGLGALAQGRWTIDAAGPRAPARCGRGGAAGRPARQLERLDGPSPRGATSRRSRRPGTPFRPGSLEIFQVNLGKLSNMTCRQCHVDAGPDRLVENMGRPVESVLAALDRTGATTST